jgi:disulfide bond formation protein DsbB
MMRTEPLASPTTLLALAVAGISFGALAVALLAQYGFGYQPCELCIYQRIAHGLTGAVALLALVAPLSAARRRTLLVVCGVLFLAGAALAFYPAGVERRWWASLTTCGGALPEAIDPANFDQLAAALTPVKPCDEIDWTIWGLSAANWNTLLSLAAGLATLSAAKQLRRR